MPKPVREMAKIDPGRGIEYWSKWAGVIGATVAVSTFAMALFRSERTVIDPNPKKDTPVVARVIGKGDEIVQATPEVLRGSAEKSGVKVMPGRQQKIDLLSYNPALVEQNVKMNLHLQAKDPDETSHLKVQSMYINDEGPLYVDFELRDGALRSKPETQQSEGDKEALAKPFQKGQNKVSLVVTTDGDQPAELQAKLDWEVDTGHLPDLYLLAIGVGDSLPHSVDDAKALYDFFGRTDTGLLFKKVHRLPLLVNEDASKDAIYDAISELNDKVKDKDVVIISISAHGTVVDDQYYMLPSGWTETDLTAPKMNKSAISKDGFLRRCGDWRSGAYVLLIMDTCHAAAITEGVTTRDVDAPVDMNRFIGSQTVKQFVDTDKLEQRMRKNPPGIMIFSACLGGEKANELGKLNHGALTFALLEGLEGKLLFNDPRTDDCEQLLPHGRVLNLAGLGHYIEERVKRLTDELSHHPQSVVVMPSGQSLSDFPLLVRPEAAANK